MIKDSQESVFEYMLSHKIHTKKDTRSIRSLYGEYCTGNLVVDTPYQRNFRWNRTKATRLIESILLNVPLPVVYIWTSEDGRLHVVDGKQRLLSVFKYIGGYWGEDAQEVFRLKRDGIGVEAFFPLIGKSYNELQTGIKSIIQNSDVQIIILDEPFRKEVQREVFSRINMAPTPLKEMEMRNSDYYGPYLQALKSLAQQPEYQKIVAIKPIQKVAMYDLEQVLRFAAFFHDGYQQYKGPLNNFLTADISKHQNDEDIDDLRAAFWQGFRDVVLLFGVHSFRRFYQGTFEHPDGGWPTEFAPLIHESFLYILSRYTTQEIEQRKDMLREALIHFMATNEEFIQVTASRNNASSHTTITRARFRLLERFVDAQMQKDDGGYRQEDKELLFDIPVCSVCKQTIKHIDDATPLIGKKEYWSQRLPENAVSFCHRFCESGATLNFE